MDALTNMQEHLRAVHFSLLAAVFVLLVASSLTPVADLDWAANEAATASWINASMSGERVSTTTRTLFAATPDNAIGLMEARLRWIWRVDDTYHPLGETNPDPPKPIVWIPYEGIAYSPPSPMPQFISVDPSKRTIRQFKHAWSFLVAGGDAAIVSRAHIARASFRYSKQLVGTNPELESGTHFDESIVDELPEGKAANDRLRFLTRFEIEHDAESNSFVMVLELMGGHGEDEHLRFGRQSRIPLETVRYPVDLLQQFLSETGHSKQEVFQRARDFGSVFRNFNEYSKGLESLTIEEFRGYLDRLRSEKGQEVELLGVKIPQRAISTWGVAVLVVVQLYFLAHLRQLVSLTGRSRHDIDFPWIALYDDILSRWMTLASLVAVPVAAGVLTVTGWRSLSSLWLQALLASGVIVTAALAFACWMTLWAADRAVGAKRSRADLQL